MTCHHPPSLSTRPDSPTDLPTLQPPPPPPPTDQFLVTVNSQEPLQPTTAAGPLLCHLLRTRGCQQFTAEPLQLLLLLTITRVHLMRHTGLLPLLPFTLPCRLQMLKFYQIKTFHYLPPQKEVYPSPPAALSIFIFILGDAAKKYWPIFRPCF